MTWGVGRLVVCTWVFVSIKYLCHLGLSDSKPLYLTYCTSVIYFSNATEANGSSKNFWTASRLSSHEWERDGYTRPSYDPKRKDWEHSRLIKAAQPPAFLSGATEKGLVWWLIALSDCPEPVQPRESFLQAASYGLNLQSHCALKLQLCFWI